MLRSVNSQQKSGLLWAGLLAMAMETQQLLPPVVGRAPHLASRPGRRCPSSDERALLSLLQYRHDRYLRRREGARASTKPRTHIQDPPRLPIDLGLQGPDKSIATVSAAGYHANVLGE